jgi:transcriptional regulator with XRE-family HTH domain
MPGNMAPKASARDPRAQFGARVRQHRKRLDLTLEQLAEDAGMHWTYIGSVERGERNISLVNIVRLARALGIGPDDLMKGLRP